MALNLLPFKVQELVSVVSLWIGLLLKKWRHLLEPLQRATYDKTHNCSRFYRLYPCTYLHQNQKSNLFYKKGDSGAKKFCNLFFCPHTNLSLESYKFVKIVPYFGPHLIKWFILFDKVFCFASFPVASITCFNQLSSSFIVCVYLLFGHIVLYLSCFLKKKKKSRLLYFEWERTVINNRRTHLVSSCNIL